MAKNKQLNHKKILSHYTYIICYKSHILDNYIIITSYYRQLSADNKMKNHKINPCFVSIEGPKNRAYKTGIDIMLFILLFVENCL